MFFLGYRGYDRCWAEFYVGVHAEVFSYVELYEYVEVYYGSETIFCVLYSGTCIQDQSKCGCFSFIEL